MAKGIAQGGVVLKKFVLVLVCTVIILFFVGFNYLLWDRESKAEDIKTLEYTNESKDDYINYLTAERKRAEIENERLTSEIKELEKTIADLNEQIEIGLENENQLEIMLKEANDLIKILKGQADRQMLEGKVTEYVEFLANKDYGKAYNMRYGHQLGYGKPQSLSEFKAGYEGSIENIIIEKVEHMGDYTGMPAGMHAVSAELNVQLKEETVESGCEFVPGINVLVFVVGFDDKLKDWVIADIMLSGS
jgi:hypothetical protein